MKITIGMKIGLLTILQRSKIVSSGHILWECICDCGNTFIARGSRLLYGTVKSCGCYRRQNSVDRFTTHGMSKTPEYNTWVNMRDRCANENNPSFKHYGGRGITVCDRWSVFENFYVDMGKSLGSEYSIERIDNDGNYEKSNCIWANRLQQQRNKRTNNLITFNGKTLTLIEWSEIVGVNYNTLRDRIMRYDWSVERAFTTK